MPSSADAPDPPPAADGPAGQARWAYGPNTPAVRRFLQRFAALRPSELERAARAYAELDATPALTSADRALAQAMERTGRAAERDAVVGPLVQLAHDPDRPRAPGAPADRDEGLALLPPVAEAALGAALALIVRDVLDARAFATLYGPFAELIPADALDAPAG